jgi:hypothetical protein
MIEMTFSAKRIAAIRATIALQEAKALCIGGRMRAIN